ncbi:LMBR1-like membrane protein [Lipomyces oligophaga]|uniref:LMBR1-like membrane protein n=1 Tax=Lipomyces oligophaga TaxID=45792 RepID=UPI0034D01812
MIWPSLVGFGILSVAVILTIDHFITRKRIPSYLLVALFSAIFIPFSIILLVPIDLATSTSGEVPLLSLPRKVTFVLWRLEYWISFGLTWLILPILQSFVESGHYDYKQKLRDAVRVNARFQLIQLIAGIFALIYCIFYSGFTLISLKAMAVALSLSYSLIFSILFLGIGIVNIPRTLFTLASPTRRLLQLEMKAVGLRDQKTDSDIEYTDVSAEVQSLAPIKSGPFENWISDLLSKARRVEASNSLNRTQINDEYLSALSSRLDRSKLLYERYNYEWSSLIFEAAKLQDIVEAKQNKSLTFRLSTTRLSPSIAYLWYCIIRPLLLYFIFGISLTISLLVLVSELLENTDYSLLGTVSAATGGLVQELISLTTITYMCLATYSSLASMKIFNIFALTPKHTALRSAIFYAFHVCRMTIPLAYSYVQMMPHRTESTVFEQFLQNSINLTPLGHIFVTWLPRLILVPVFFSFFNAYERIQRSLGFSDDFGDYAEDFGSRAEGRDLISLDIRRRLS